MGMHGRSHDSLQRRRTCITKFVCGWTAVIVTAYWPAARAAAGTTTDWTPAARELIQGPASCASRVAAGPSTFLLDKALRDFTQPAHRCCDRLATLPSDMYAAECSN